MAYAQNTLTSPNAANDFATVVAGLLIGSGWTLVETLTPSGNYRNSIYKSPAASNLCGYDWYIALRWTTVGTENYVQVIPAQAYDSGTKLLSGICGAGFPTATPNIVYSSEPTTGYTSSTTLNMATLTVSPAPTTITQRQKSSTTTTTPGFQTLIPSSAFAYWMSITLDHVAIWTTVSVNSQDCVMSTLNVDPAYVAEGIYNENPIVSWDSTFFRMSSHLLGVAITSTTYVAAHANYSGVYGAKLPFLVDTYLDAYAWAPEIYLDYLSLGPSNPIGGTQLVGMAHVGTCPDILMVWGGSIGDTIEVSGSTYVLSNPMTSNTSSEAQPTLAVLVE